MPNYLTVDDFKDQYDRQYAKLYEDDGTPNETWMAEDIDRAESRIDAYLSKRYVTPIASGADTRLLQEWTVVLAMAVAFRRKPSMSIPKSLQESVKEVLAELKQAADGEINLGAPTLPPQPTHVTEGIVVEGNEPLFERSSLSGF